ncbi:hypothetical protein AB1Y20_016061 [Prymnesium parvum]|uniref:SGNH hydrolase-type esterase domain-containing protein n=1 Tax=Prymnesium parvum TaxID=97485 RepID=A0AB34K2H3_PRYPA
MAEACVLHAAPQRPVLIGVLGTSLSWGADLSNRTEQAWPFVLQRLLRQQPQFRNVWVVNGAMRASSADFAALCFDAMFGPEWTDASGAARGPRLDLALLEYNWSSSPAQIAALIDALHARAVPAIGVLYVHPVNVHRVKTLRHDPTPDKGADAAGRYDDFARVFARYGVPWLNTSAINRKLGWRAVIGPLLSAAHITAEAHAALASELLALVHRQCSSLHEQLAPRGAAPLASRRALRGAGGRGAADRAAGAPRTSPIALGGVCKIGARSLGSLVVAAESFFPLTAGLGEGRTTGYVAYSRGALLRLAVPKPRVVVGAGATGTTGGFLSLGIERSYRTKATATISCHGCCICAGQQFDAHTSKKYTYLQRTIPKWLYWPSPVLTTDSSSDLEQDCIVEVLLADITNGSRLFVKALTFSPPRAGNKSVSVGTLYSLP